MNWLALALYLLAIPGFRVGTQAVDERPDNGPVVGNARAYWITAVLWPVATVIVATGSAIMLVRLRLKERGRGVV